MIEQLIKDQCERNRKEWYDSQFNTFGVETKEEELKNLDQITQQTAEAVLSAVREYIEDQDGILYRDTLLTTLEEEVSK